MSENTLSAVLAKFGKRVLKGQYEQVQALKVEKKHTGNFGPRVTGKKTPAEQKLTPIEPPEEDRPTATTDPDVPEQTTPEPETTPPEALDKPTVEDTVEAAPVDKTPPEPPPTSTDRTETKIEKPLSLKEMETALQGNTSEAFFDQLLESELDRVPGPRKGALTLLREVETSREAPRKPVLLEIAGLLKNA